MMGRRKRRRSGRQGGGGEQVSGAADGHAAACLRQLLAAGLNGTWLHCEQACGCMLGLEHVICAAAAQKGLCPRLLPPVAQWSAVEALWL